MLKVDDFRNKSFLTSAELKMKALLDEMKQLFTFENEFVYGKKSTSRIGFGNFELSALWTRE